MKETITAANTTRDFLYVAEYLQRIGTVFLVISLDSKCSALHLRFPDKPSRNIELMYIKAETNNPAGQEQQLFGKIELPTEFALKFAGVQKKLTGGRTVQLSIKTDLQHSLTKEFHEKLSFLEDDQDSNPWSIKQLKTLANDSKDSDHVATLSYFKCKVCNNTLISTETITTWKALPSETWAEMMDFWHCHKPSDDDHNHSHSHSDNSDLHTSLASVPSFNPSYAVSSFEAYPSTALVGLSYILFHSSHFLPNSINQLTEVSNAKYPLLTCASCNTWLGYVNSQSTLRVFKWSLKLVSDQKLLIPSFYPEYLFLSATIAELIRSHGIYTFSLLEEDYYADKNTLKAQEKEVALIWIFNPDIQYCTNADTSIAPTTEVAATSNKGYKVFYSADSNVIPELKQTRGDVEQIYFPRKIIDSILTHLENHFKLYPAEVQTFGNKNWKASILDQIK